MFIKCNLVTNDYSSVSGSLVAWQGGLRRSLMCILFGGLGSSTTAAKFNILLCKQISRVLAIIQKNK